MADSTANDFDENILWTGVSAKEKKKERERSERDEEEKRERGERGKEEDLRV